MRWVGSVSATRAWRTWNACRVSVLLLVVLAGCTAGGQTSGLLADARGNAIAIDSVDGAPARTSQKFVGDLKEAASARQIAFMPREASVPYRLRGYLAIHTRGATTSIAWAWDIYDTAEQRAFRLSGEEPAKAGRKSWAAADDEVLGRIARSSVEQIAVFLANPRTAPRPESASIFAEHGRTLLSRIDDFSPEASGIFRILRKEPEAVAISQGDASSPAAVPLPPGRPAPGGRRPGALAFTDGEAQ